MSTSLKMRRMSYARVSKAVKTIQLVIVIAIVMVAVGGYLFLHARALPKNISEGDTHSNQLVRAPT